MADLYSPTYSLGNFTIDSSLAGPASSPSNFSAQNPPSAAEFFQILQGAIQSGLTVFSSVYGVVNSVSQDGTMQTQAGTQNAATGGSFNVTNSQGQSVASGSVESGDGLEGLQYWALGGIALVGLLVLAVRK